MPAYIDGRGRPDVRHRVRASRTSWRRASGFAYDIKGDGKWKAYGSWGVFYDIFKLELPRGSFGGDKWLEYYYTLDTYAWDTLVSASGCPPACSGTLIRGPIDFRHVVVRRGRHRARPEADEEPGGVVRPRAPALAGDGRQRPLRPQVARPRDRGHGLARRGRQRDLHHRQPGRGPRRELRLDEPGHATSPKAKRDYDSVEFAFTKNLSNNWYLRGSYLWSRLYGNYSGLSQSDENGRTSPNVGRAFDYPIMSVRRERPAGRTARWPPIGRTSSRRSSSTSCPSGTSLGLNQYIASGIPVTREVGVLPTSNFPVQYLGRVSDGRHADVLADRPEPAARVQAGRLPGSCSSS